MARLEEKAPAYQHYPKDWASDEAVKLMTWEQRGIYRELLDHQWLEGSIPGDVEQLAVLLRIPLVRFRKKIWPLIATKFTPVDNDGGRLMQLRLERQRDNQEEFIQGKKIAGSKGGKERARRHAEAKQRASNALALLDSASSKTVAESKPASASASATEDPPNPPAARGAVTVHAGRITRAERAAAEKALHDWEVHRDQWQKPGLNWADESTWPLCPHDDSGGAPCDSRETCIGALVQGARLRLASGQQRVLEAAS